MMAIKDVGAMLLRHLGVHEGQWDVVVEFQAAFGSMGPAPESALPSALIGISKIGLVRSIHPGPLTIDAAAVNPAP